MATGLQRLSLNGAADGLHPVTYLIKLATIRSPQTARNLERNLLNMYQLDELLDLH